MAIVKNTENQISSLAESVSKITQSNALASAALEDKISELEHKLTEQTKIINQKIDKLLSAAHAETPTGFN